MLQLIFIFFERIKFYIYLMLSCYYLKHHWKACGIIMPMLLWECQLLNSHCFISIGIILSSRHACISIQTQWDTFLIDFLSIFQLIYLFANRFFAFIHVNYDLLKGIHWHSRLIRTLPIMRRFITLASAADILLCFTMC